MCQRREGERVKLTTIPARIWRAPLSRTLLPLLVVMLLGCIFNQNGAFFAWPTHRAMLREIAVVGILACGMTVVIITAGIDLAVGSVMALCAVGFAKLSMQLGWGAAGTTLAVLGLGVMSGLTSGGLVARFRLQPFVVTLAMMVFARGAAKWLSGGQKITNYVTDSTGQARVVELPAAFELLDARWLDGNLSVVTVLFGACALITWVLLSRLRVGRYLYAIGGNREAARLSGVPVIGSTVFAYVYCGALTAVAGICQAAQETHGDPETGMGYELDAIAMVVLGGSSLMGGRGGMGLTLVGALTVGYLQKVLSLNAFSSEARLMLTGIILVAAVMFQRRTSTS